MEIKKNILNIKSELFFTLIICFFGWHKFALKFQELVHEKRKISDGALMSYVMNFCNYRIFVYSGLQTQYNI